MKCAKRALVVIILIPVFLCAQEQIAVDHTKEIVFGQSGSFTGHFKYYGNAIRDAINTCFAYVNSRGGIQGKKLRLISLDDHGDAELTKKNIELLHTKYGVTMFIGVMGSRGINLVLDQIKEKKIGIYFPWESDKKLTDPSLTNVVNAFGLLEPQVDLLARHVVQVLGYKTIAIFHSDDTLATDAAEYLRDQLKKEGATPLGMIRYNRFSMNIPKCAEDIMALDPRAVICLGTNIPVARLISYFLHHGFFGTNFFGIDKTFLVRDLLQNKSASFHYVSLVPDIISSDLPLAQEYRAEAVKYMQDADITTFSFSYYIAATILCTAMQAVQGPLTNAAIIAHLELFKKKNIKGFEVDFNPSNRSIWNSDLWII